MKVVFIDPKGFSDGLNTGLGYLSSVLINNGHDVSVIDFNNKNGNENKRLEIIRNADFVGLSIKSFTLDESIQVAEKVREINKHAKIVAGGPHITLDGPNFMEENSLFDIAVVGEGEETILDIVDGKDLHNVKGIVFRDDGKIIVNENRDWIQNLDELPFPNYECFDSVNSKINDYPLVTSRGCPFSCSYCSVNICMGRQWRARSPNNIIMELMHAKREYHSKEFKVLDDNFTLDMNRAKNICQALIDNKINMRWSCPNGIRADKLDMELLVLMKRSGCFSISIGIESGVEDVFNRINKGESLEDVKNAVLMAKKIGLKVNGFFIIGLPGSTFEKDKQSMRFAKNLNLDSASWGILVPYPGTGVWEWLSNEARYGRAKLLCDWKKGFHIGFRPKPIFETKQYRAGEMLKAYYLANFNTIGWGGIPDIFKLLFKRIKLI